MNAETNESAKFAGWIARRRPGATPLHGRYTRLEALNWPAHRDGLFDAICGEGKAGLWRYLAFDMFTDPATFAATFEETRAKTGMETMVIRAAATGRVLGMASYMNIHEAHGCAEVGWIAFGPELQRTREATEAMYLMAAHVFDDLGYRRYEWKCDNHNEPSKRAAARFGFLPEGVFRKHMVVKGLNRDTAWFAMTDDDWATCKPIYQAWLATENFDAGGVQIARLRVGGDG
jgi:RimJ/RimL family protein N-acetyltransferase